MKIKASRPDTARNGAGPGIGFSSAATSGFGNITLTHQDQHEFAIRWIARRARVSLATARANAEAFGIGGQQ